MNFQAARLYYRIALPFTHPLRKNPIVVHQMGKVGSSTVCASLKRAEPETPVFQVHYLSHEGLRRVESANLTAARRVPPAHIWESKYLQSLLAEGKERRWRVITLVREPISRNVSAFFENIYLRFPDFDQRVKRGSLDVQALIGEFVDGYNHDIPLNWFDEEMKSVFGIDVYETPFDSSLGYSIIDSDRVTLLILRLEDLVRCAGDALSRFLALRGFGLVSANVGGKKGYGPIYDEFIESIRLPQALVDRMYASRYARHFYTPEEIEGFRQKWISH